jgi:hypothetical protein
MTCSTSDSVPSTPLFFGWEYADLIGAAILKFPAGHELVAKLCEKADAAGTNIQWGAIGPNLVMRLVAEAAMTPLACPQPVAYPVQSMDAMHLLMPARRDEIWERIGNSPFLHLWNEVMRRAVILPWMAPPAGSFLAELFVRHGIGFGDALAYTADQVRRLNDNYFAAASWSHDVATKAELARLETRVNREHARAEGLESEVVKLREHLRMLQSSRSWRLTAPLRNLAKLLRDLTALRQRGQRPAPIIVAPADHHPAPSGRVHAVTWYPTR